MTSLVAVLTAVSALGGLGTLATFFYVRAMRRKINAQAAVLEVEPDVLLSKQAMEMYDRMASEAREHKVEARSCAQEKAALFDHVRVLEDMIRKRGGKPPTFRAPTTLQIASHDDTA